MEYVEQERSALGRRWVPSASPLGMRSKPDDTAEQAAMQYLRGARAMKSWQAYLTTHPLSFDDAAGGRILRTRLLPLLDGLKDAEAAAHCLADAVTDACASGRGIGISGDYDADGLGSTALMIRFLHSAGVPASAIHPHIPNRFGEGYGINEQAVGEMHARGCGTVIALDNGIHAHAAFHRAAELGIARRIVLDHHPNRPGDTLPDALAVDPKRADEPFRSQDRWGIADLAGVGVTWQVCRRAAAILAERGHYAAHHRTMPDPLDELALVATSTLVDVVHCGKPLNHALITEGLKRLRQGSDPYLMHLCRVAGVVVPPYDPQESITITRLIEQQLSTDIRFTIGPILNAPGRMDQSVAWAFLIPPGACDLATDMWVALDRVDASLRQALEAERHRRIARHTAREGDAAIRYIDRSLQPDAPHDEATRTDGVSPGQYALMLKSRQLNDKRKLLESLYTREARAQAEDYLSRHPDAPCLVLAGEGWHEGVVGIVAGRIKEEFNLPSFVISQEGGHAKGSARSILPEADIGAFVLQQRSCGTLSKGGGHAMAAGFSLRAEAIDTLRHHAEAHFSMQVPALLARQTFPVDRAWNLASPGMHGNRNAVEQMQDFITGEQAALGYFAEGRRQPVVALTGFRIAPPQHSHNGRDMRVELRPANTTFGAGWTVPAIAFRAVGTRLGEMLRQAASGTADGKQLVLYGSLQADKNSDLRQPGFTFRIEDAQMLHPDSHLFAQLFRPSVQKEPQRGL